jgi:tRNA (Thr-GGU) A37 N-methylase
MFRPEGTGWIEVFPEYEEGLKDIEGFSHIILVYIFDRLGPVHLVRPTLLDDTPHGIFAIAPSGQAERYRPHHRPLVGAREIDPARERYRHAGLNARR